MIPTATVTAFRDLLAERFGWRVDDTRQLSHLLAAREGAGHSLERYLSTVRTAGPSSPEMRALVDAFAVSETYFFRNPEQFAVLAEVALPAAVARRPGAPLRILSAGAASGEEAYSVAMTVLRAGTHHALPPVEIVGVDVSGRVLERARRGRYSAWALRGLPPDIRREFFVTDGRHFDVRADVASMVRFQEGNLLDLSVTTPGPWDVVFCRNTLMYFTPPAARRILASLAEAIVPGGFLFLGHAETPRGLSDAFALEHSHNTFYYRRPGAERRGTSWTPVLPPSTAAWTPPAAAADDEWFHEIARATERVAALVDGPRQPVASPAPPGDATRSAAASRRGTTAALELLRQERYEDALVMLETVTSPEGALVRAVVLAQMGRVTEASAACQAVLAADSMHAGAYYVLALCAERGGDDASAVRHDEMAIYLDDTFAMPHLHLALLRQRQGDRPRARLHARRALDLFAGEDDLRILLFGNGFTRKAMRQLCQTQLQSLAS